jgi:hypothetical protein
MKEVEMSKTSRTHGEDTCKILAGKHYGTRAFGRPRSGRKYNATVLKMQKI